MIESIIHWALGLNPIEVIAVMFSLFCVILTIWDKIWCWSVGIVGIVAYFFLFQESKDWSNMILQIVYLGQSFYGWYVWNKQKKTLFTQLDFGQRRDSIIYCVLLLVSFMTINTFYHGNSTFVDALTTSLSLVGMFLLAHKKWENWIFWAVADSFYIGMFIQNQQYLSAGLYVIFLLLAIYGIINWKKIGI